jgi:hypothetical protein
VVVLHNQIKMVQRPGGLLHLRNLRHRNIEKEAHNEQKVKAAQPRMADPDITMALTSQSASMKVRLIMLPRLRRSLIPGRQNMTPGKTPPVHVGLDTTQLKVCGFRARMCEQGRHLQSLDMK